MWLDNTPVMICCNAGRESNDYSQRYLLNKEKYKELIMLAKTLKAQQTEPEESLKEVALDKEIPEMTEFYSSKLDGHFRPYDY